MEDQALPPEAGTTSTSTQGISSETITRSSVAMMATVVRTSMATSHPTTGRETVRLACVEACGTTATETPGTVLASMTHITAVEIKEETIKMVVTEAATADLMEDTRVETTKTTESPSSGLSSALACEAISEALQCVDVAATERSTMADSEVVETRE